MRTRETVRSTTAVGRFAGYATALILVCVVQAGLFPFNFATALPSGVTRVFFSSVTHDLIVPDIVSNIVLYVPVGLCLAWVIRRRNRSGIASLVIAILVGVLISASVEFAQAFLPSRVSSAIDLTSNVVGTAIGGAVALGMRWSIPRLFDAFVREARSAPAALFAKLYALMLVVAAAVPFTFTFDANRLLRSIRDAEYVPFASLSSVGAFAQGDAKDVGARVSSDKAKAKGDTTYAKRHPAAFAAWQWYRDWARWMAECASLMLLGLLVFRALRVDYGFARNASVALCLWICGGLSFGLSGLQLFITTRVFDITDILARLTGLSLSFAVIAIARVRARAGTPAHRPRDSWILPRAPLFIGAFIMYLGLIPFSYEWSAERFVRSVSSTAFFPFASYDAARFDVMLGDLLEKLGVWTLFALCIAALRCSANRGRSHRSVLVHVLSRCFALALVIELIQCFSPLRVASLTDPAVAAIGATIGVALQQRASLMIDYMRSESARRSVADRPLGQRRGLSPMDELIASLTEEREDAPREPTPQPTHTSPR